MSPSGRWMVSVGVALAASGALGVLLVRSGGRLTERPEQAPAREAVPAMVERNSVAEAPRPAEVQRRRDEAVTGPEKIPGSGTEKAAPVERLIEEVLAEAGEDPGAVFYMSWVREALGEGNPAFAQELLRQMKEQHPKSVLVDEAEILFEERR